MKNTEEVDYQLYQHHFGSASFRSQLITMPVVPKNIRSYLNKDMALTEHMHYGA
jgi:hypothetical protein